MKYLFLLFLVACDTYYVTVKKEYIDRESLASNFVRSPDPRQEDPLLGQVLVMQWNLPRAALDEELVMQLRVIYRDYEEEIVTYELKKRRGSRSFALMDERLKETGGFLTYKVEIMNLQGRVVEQWTQQLWVELLELDEDDSLDF